MDHHDHFTAVVCEYRIFLCGEMIEQLVGMCQRFFGWVGWLQSDGAYGCSDCAVDGSSVEEEIDDLAVYNTRMMARPQGKCTIMSSLS